jgi:hypothetical protein
MSNYTHQTAPTQFVEASGIRFGAKIDIPLLSLAASRLRNFDEWTT